MATVWLLLMEGIGIAGTGGLFHSRESAETHARYLDAKSDHYHSWRVVEMSVGSPLEPEYLFLFESEANKGPREVPIKCETRPGSHTAVAMGCHCPPMDNYHGTAYRPTIIEGCPLHWKE